MIHGKSIKYLVKISIFLVMVVAGSSVFAGSSQASGDHHESAEKNNHSSLELSSGVVDLLNQEMRGIEGGMQSILPAISAGDWEEIATISQKIKASFILKQKLTKEQRQELHRTLPADFVAMDQYFHLTAGKLAKAAHQQDSELVSFYYYKLHNQCAKCHTKYAAERFPSLSKSAQKAEHKD